MARHFICYLFVFSLFTLGIERAVDSVGGEHPHGGDIVYITDSETHDSLELHDDGHCPNCCHGHAGHIDNYFSPSNCKAASQQIAAYQPHFQNLAQAPPTPPPNA